MSTVKADNFTWKTGQATGQTGTNVTGDQIVYGVAKGWINFYGVSSVTVNKSYNMSSVTRAATGKYQMFFTTSFADSYYCFSGSSTSQNESDSGNGTRWLSSGSPYHSYIGRTTGDIKTIVCYDSANITDGVNINASFDR